MTCPPSHQSRSDGGLTTAYSGIDGWRTGAKFHEVGVAHCYLNGYSLCHRWLTTKFDREFRPGDERCAECQERTHG